MSAAWEIRVENAMPEVVHLGCGRDSYQLAGHTESDVPASTSCGWKGRAGLAAFGIPLGYLGDPLDLLATLGIPGGFP